MSAQAGVNLDNPGAAAPGQAVEGSEAVYLYDVLAVRATVSPLLRTALSSAGVEDSSVGRL